MSFATIDQDLALVLRLGVIEQPNRSIQLIDGICDPSLSKQQQAVLCSCDDRQLAERSTIGEPLRVHQKPNTFAYLAHLVSWIAQTQQNPRGDTVVLNGTFWELVIRPIARHGRTQGAHCLAEQSDCLGVMAKVGASDALIKKICGALVVTPTRNICPHSTNFAQLFTLVQIIESPADFRDPYPWPYGGQPRLVSRFVSDRV
jgi:hypothetical protein